MRLWTRIAFVLLFVPLLASAQYRDLDGALGNLQKGFSSGDTQAILVGIADGDQVMLNFPGLTDKSGFFGRDQAAYLLDGLFSKVKPSDYTQVSVRKVSAENQYHIEASWTIQNAGKPEVRQLYIALRFKNDHWWLVSVRSAGK